MLDWETERRVIRNIYYTVPVNKYTIDLGYSELKINFLFTTKSLILAQDER